MAKLIYFSTHGKWLEYPLGELTRIGRHPDQDLQLLDRIVSKAHAEIVFKGGRYYLRDVGSRNGTVLNESLVNGMSLLEDGDEISLGNHVLRFVDDNECDVTRSDILPKIGKCVEAEGKPDGSHDMESFPQSSSVSMPIWEVQSPVSPVAGLEGMMEPIRKRVRNGAFRPESEIRSESELRRDYEKLRVGAELSSEVSAIFDMERLVGIIIEKAFEFFHADRAAILLRDESGAMQTRIAVHRDGTPIGNFKISERLLDEVILEKSAVLSADALQDQRFASSKSIVCDNVRSTMCVPLLYQDEVLGVINLDTQMVTGAFVEKDLQILTGFARQVALTIQQNRQIEEMRRNAVIRNNLRRIISPHLIDDVMSGKLELQKSGSRIEASVLFADIRGFSKMAEDNAPEDIVNMLNEFFERMVDCIFKHDGVVDKFVGDEVMAEWGVGVSVDRHARHAVMAAIDMMRAVDLLNESRHARLLPPISIGIGIATGMMIAGYMGSTQAMSYTVIGDTVNLASRLCSAARGGEILVNHEAYEAVCGEQECFALPPIMVKGKSAPVMVYRVLR